jgi:E3 ubiquitin-protein ligase HECTD2
MFINPYFKVYKYFKRFFFVAKLMGLAVYNGEILDIRFPPVVYKKLLTVDSPSLSSTNSIGTSSHLTLFDLKQVMPDLASSLYDLLAYDGNVQETFMLKFQVSYSEYDMVKTAPLKRNGENIDLTNENRKEYVDLYVDFLLNKLIYEQFKAFYLGFHSVCASNAMLVKFEIFSQSKLSFELK